MTTLNARANQAWEAVDAESEFGFEADSEAFIEGWERGYKTAAAEIAAAFEPALYNSPDGDDFAHTHPPEEGEPECPACWVQHIRQILARSTGGVP